MADQLGETTKAPVILAHADLVMTDVDTNDWFKSMKVAHTEGTARLDYTKLSSLAARRWRTAARAGWRSWSIPPWLAERSRP